METVTQGWGSQKKGCGDRERRQRDGNSGTGTEKWCCGDRDMGVGTSGEGWGHWNEDTGMGTGTLFLGRNRVTRVGAGTGDIQTEMGRPYRNGAVSSVPRATSACWGIDGQGWGQTRNVTVSPCPQDYLHSLGKGRTAQVQRDARVGEAEAKRDAGIRVSLSPLSPSSPPGPPPCVLYVPTSPPFPY